MVGGHGGRARRAGRVGLGVGGGGGGDIPRRESGQPDRGCCGVRAAARARAAHQPSNVQDYSASHLGRHDALLAVEVGRGLINQVDVRGLAQAQRDGHALGEGRGRDGGRVGGRAAGAWGPR